MISMKDRFRGCMVGLACGDSLGFPLEFVNTREAIQKAYPNGITFPEIPIYSDDTQMSLCVAEALVSAGDDMEAFMMSLSSRFVEWFKSQNDPALSRNPSDACLMGCEQLAFGIHWSESGAIDGMGCESGTRSAPIGLYHMDDITTLVEYGIAASETTHREPSALCSSVATALLTSMAVNSVPIGTWGHELMIVTRGISDTFTESMRIAIELAARKAPPEVAMSAKFLGHGWSGHEAVACALYCCLMDPSDFERAVKTAAGSEGDSDSIACIAGAWMGARLGIQGIPPDWVEKIENRDGLIDVADRLYAAKMESISRRAAPK